VSPATGAAGLLAGKTDAELVDMVTMAEAKRSASTETADFMAYADVVGMIHDELDRRHPNVLGEWDDRCAAGEDADLTAMYRAAI